MAMKSKVVPDDKEIYLAFSTVFKGAKAEVRRQSVIKRLVQHNAKQPEVAAFFRKNSHDGVRDVLYERLKILLEQRIFELYSRAKLKFPDIFEKSAIQNAERAASEAAAATDHARAIEGALLGDEEVSDDTVNDSDETCAHPDTHLSDDLSVPSAQERIADGADLTSAPSIPPLFPIRLPFITGHQIIVKAQAILEQACFNFAQDNMPEVLESRGWDCAAAVELNVWVWVFRQHEHSPLKASETDTRLDGSFFKSLRDIRHTAVHRLPMTAAGYENCLRDGELLATLLDDSAATRRLSAMRCELQRVTAEMEDHKCMLEAKLTRTLERIAAERAELDRQEREAINGMVQADSEYQLYAGASLEERLAKLNAEVIMESDRPGTADDGDEDSDEIEGASLGNTVEDFEELGFLLAL